MLHVPVPRSVHPRTRERSWNDWARSAVQADHRRRTAETWIPPPAADIREGGRDRATPPEQPQPLRC